MEIEKHFKEFQEIIKKYGLSDEQKSEEIAHFLTKKTGSVSAKDFAIAFAMKEEEAEIFLGFIEKGIKFKEKHIDKK